MSQTKGYHDIKWDQALCRGATDLFYPDRSPQSKHRAITPASRQLRQRLQQARAVCAECPIRQDCRVWGVRNEPSGIWGGVLVDGARTLDLWDLDTVWIRLARPCACDRCDRVAPAGEDVRRMRVDNRIICARCAR